MAVPRRPRGELGDGGLADAGRPGLRELSSVPPECSVSDSGGTLGTVSTRTQRHLNVTSTAPSPAAQCGRRRPATRHPVRSKAIAAARRSRVPPVPDRPARTDSSATINRCQPACRPHGASCSAARAYISRAARTSPGQQFDGAQNGQRCADPDLVPGGLERGQAAPRVRPGRASTSPPWRCSSAMLISVSSSPAPVAEAHAEGRGPTPTPRPRRRSRRSRGAGSQAGGGLAPWPGRPAAR